MGSSAQWCRLGERLRPWQWCLVLRRAVLWRGLIYSVDFSYTLYTIYGGCDVLWCSPSSYYV